MLFLGCKSEAMILQQLVSNKATAQITRTPWVDPKEKFAAQLAPATIEGTLSKLRPGMWIETGESLLDDGGSIL